MAKQTANKPKSNRLLPIFGLLLGLAFALVALVLVPTARNYLIRQGVAFGGASTLVIDVLIGVVMWLVMFGLAMFIVSLAIGTHEDDKTAKAYYKRSADRRKHQKYETEMKRRKRVTVRDSDKMRK